MIALLSVGSTGSSESLKFVLKACIALPVWPCLYRAVCIALCRLTSIFAFGWQAHTLKILHPIESVRQKCDCKAVARTYWTQICRHLNRLERHTARCRLPAQTDGGDLGTHTRQTEVQESQSVIRTEVSK